MTFGSLFSGIGGMDLDNAVNFPVWIQSDQARTRFWWLCRLCWSEGRDCPSERRVDGLLVRHLRYTHGLPGLPKLPKENRG